MTYANSPAFKEAEKAMEQADAELIRTGVVPANYLQVAVAYRGQCALWRAHTREMEKALNGGMKE